MADLTSSFPEDATVQSLVPCVSKKPSHFPLQRYLCSTPIIVWHLSKVCSTLKVWIVTKMGKNLHQYKLQGFFSPWKIFFDKAFVGYDKFPLRFSSTKIILYLCTDNLCSLFSSGNNLKKSEDKTNGKKKKTGLWEKMLSAALILHRLRSKDGIQLLCSVRHWLLSTPLTHQQWVIGKAKIKRLSYSSGACIDLLKVSFH